MHLTWPAGRRINRARLRRADEQHRRRRTALVVLLALALAAAGFYALAGPQGIWGLAWVQDDYLDTSQVDLDQTTAVVDTARGVVRLPQQARGGAVPPVLAALRPGTQQLAVAMPSPGAQQPDALAGYAHDGTGFRPLPAWSVAGLAGVRALAWTGDGTHLAAALPGEIRVYAVSPAATLRQIAAVPLTAAGLAGAQGPDLWALAADGTVRYLAWDGTQYREVPPWALSGFAAPRAISANPGLGVLLVLDGDSVRYFAQGPAGYREVPALGLRIVGAVSVAALQGGGYRVLVLGPPGQPAKALYVGTSGAGARLVPALEDALPSDAFALVPSPWGTSDYAVLTGQGLMYRAFDGTTTRADPARSISGTWWRAVAAGSAYVPDAVLVSIPWRTQVPVGRVRIIPAATVPVATSVAYDVSTDAGNTWTEVVPNTNTDVPPGYDLRYRVRLHTDDPAVTPEVDRFELRQVVWVEGPAQSFGIRVHARLVR